MFHILGQVSKEKLYFLVSKQLTMLFTDCLAQNFREKAHDEVISLYATVKPYPVVQSPLLIA